MQKSHKALEDKEVKMSRIEVNDKEESMKPSIFDQQVELLKKGVNNPSLSEDQRKILIEYNNIIAQLKECAKPFGVLEEAASKGADCFQKELAKFYSALLFIQGRTSDDIARLLEMSRNMLASIRGEKELVEKHAKESAANNKSSDRKATIAICIAVASLMASIVVGYYFGRQAHKDSGKSSADIVSAIQSMGYKIDKLVNKENHEDNKP